jgi:hypothetical protein
MKTILTLVLGLGIMQGAFAGEGLNCREVGTGPDNGYRINITADRKTAEVSTVAISGTTVLATLQCHIIRSQLEYPDQILTTLTCFDAQTPDNGYSVLIREGGIAGLTTASLSKVEFTGAEEIATLNCRAAE